MDAEEIPEASRQLPPVPSDEVEDFLDFLPDRPDDEGPPMGCYPPMLRDFLEAESEALEEPRALPPPPEEDGDSDSSEGAPKMLPPPPEDVEEPPGAVEILVDEPPRTMSFKERAKAALKGRVRKTKEKAPVLMRSPSRLSEISNTSFLDDALTSQHSEQVSCGRCRCEVSAAGQCCSLFVVSFLVVLGISLRWLQPPEVSLGAFGHLKQVLVPDAISDAYFQRAWMQLSDLRSFTQSVVQGNSTTEESYRWHTVEVIWQIGPTATELEQGFQPSVVSHTYLSEVRFAEADLRDLPLWQPLCALTPVQVRFLCDLGDSIATLAFPSWKEPSQEKMDEGLDWEVSFDAQGVSQLPVETILAFAEQVRPQLLERWLARDPATLGLASSPASRQLLRSTFLFYLPPEAESRFAELVVEIRDFLRLKQEKSMSAKGGLRGYYRIDGRDYEDLDLSFNYVPFAISAAANVFFTVLLLTRRLLLCCSALVLMAAACATTSDMEVLPVTVVSWQLLAVIVVEAALASSSLLSNHGHRVLVKLQELKNLVSLASSERGNARQWLLTWLETPLQLFMPILGVFVTLQVLSSSLESIPMAKEWNDGMALGVLVIVFGGPGLFIPAVLMGDWMAEARNAEETWLPAWVLPKELVWRPMSKEKRRQKRRYALFAINSYKHRAACPVLLFISLLLLILVGTVQAPLGAETPELFAPGQLHREGRAAKAALGVLPDPTYIADTALRNATACGIDAVSSASCSWFLCAPDKVTLSGDSCVCDYRLVESSGSCKAQARFSGIEELPEGFWPWVETIFPLNSRGNASSRQEAPLEVEDWSLGQNLLQKQVFSTIKTELSGSSCFRAQCYCGPRRCERGNSGWLTLGELALPARSTPAPSSEEGQDVFMVWGLQKKTATDAALEWAPEMDWADPQVQRAQLRSCSATPPDLPILWRRCWALDFRDWLVARGERFPVARADFPDRFVLFKEEMGDQKYFWHSADGGLAGTVAQLRVDLPREQLRGRWQSYMSARRMSPWSSNAWLAIAAATEEEELQLLEAATIQVAGLFVLMLAVWTCVFTCSLRMALAACSAAGYCVLLYFLCRPFGSRSAVLQLVSLLLLVAGSASPLARFIFFYSNARNGPGKRVKNEKSFSFELEVEEQPKRTSYVRQEAIPRGQTQRFLSLETEAEDPELQKEREHEQRRAQVAAERKEMQSLFRGEAIRSERRNRTNSALCHFADVSMGHLCSLLIAWLTLWLAPETLGEVKSIFPLLAITLVTAILGQLPILILFGLGSSRVWRQAFLAFMGAITGWNRRFGGPACSFPELRTPQDDELEVSRAIKVLGWPFTRLSSMWMEQRVGSGSVMPQALPRRQ